MVTEKQFPMTIGMILDSNFPPDPRVENEAVSLIKAGHEIHVLSFNYGEDWASEEMINGINVHRIQLSKLYYKLSALAYTLPFYHWFLKKKIVQFISEQQIDVLHIHDIRSARAVFMANKKSNLPTVLDLHENRPEIMRYYGHINTVMGKLLISPKRWRKFEFKFIKKATKVIVVTREARDYYLKFNLVEPTKFHVVPNSILPGFYTTFEIDETVIERYRDSFTVLYIGDTALRRGLQTVISSLEYLIPSIPNIKLIFVGQSKADSVLKEMVAKNNWEDYVDMVGWQDPVKFPSYIKASDVGICPIHRNIHHNTTYANKIFQYLSFGKPVLVSNCDAQQTLIEEHQCGLVFLDRNPKDFSEKLQILHNNDEWYSTYSNNAESAIRTKLNWDHFSSELIKLYDIL